jgi:nucleoside-diphosphate-sugar epimerase
MYDTSRKLVINPKEPKVLGPGNEERNFIHIDDVVEALNLVTEKENVIGQVLNIGCGKVLLTRNLINEMMRFLAVKPTRIN